MAFNSLAGILEECSAISAPPALLFVCFSFVKVEEISQLTLILFRPGSIHSG